MIEEQKNKTFSLIFCGFVFSGVVFEEMFANYFRTLLGLTILNTIILLFSIRFMPQTTKIVFYTWLITVILTTISLFAAI